MTEIRKTLSQELKTSHTQDAIRARLAQGPQHSYLRDFIYGAVDGTVTTFAVVSGVAGAHLSSGIVIILGAANLLGDGFSMAISNYLGTRAEDQLRKIARKMEEHHIETVPEGEREEIRQIFAAKGFSGADLENAVRVITSNRKQWVETMLREELGITVEGVSPWRAAASTFAAFLAVGLLPLTPFLFDLFFRPANFNAFLMSALMTGAGFFVIGALKSRFVNEPWPKAGLETLFVGGAAAGLAYLVGAFLRKFVAV